MGRVLRTTLPTGKGGVVHLFVVYGYQWAEEDADQLLLTDKLLQAVLAEAQVVCIGQPMLIAGDLNADPAVIPCMAKAISEGRFVDLALAYSLGKGKKPAATCKVKLDECSGMGREFILGCPNAVAASTACIVTDRWFLPHFSLFATFGIDGWSAEVSCPIVSQPLWPACWIDTPDRSSSSTSRAVQDAWDLCRDELGVVPPDIVLALRGLFRACCRAGGPAAAGLPFWEEACYEFVVCVLETELLVAWDRVGSRSSGSCVQVSARFFRSSLD